MEITYLGHSCFRLKNKEGLVVYMDPFKSEVVGLSLPKDVADVVTISGNSEDHNNESVITGPINRESVFVIDKVGEYEIAGVQFAATKTLPGKGMSEGEGKNLLISIVMDGIHIVHLGDLGGKLTDSQIEKLGSVDVLMIPVGGKTTIDADEAMDLLKDIQPSFAIPMHYKTVDSKVEGLTTLDVFLEKNKYPIAGESVHKVKVDGSSLPDDTQILIMNG